MALAGPASAGPGVVSLDQCADQYVLALAPRADIKGLSYRARPSAEATWRILARTPEKSVASSMPTTRTPRS